MKTAIAVRAASGRAGRSSLPDATRTTNEGNTKAIEAIDLHGHGEWLISDFVQGIIGALKQSLVPPIAIITFTNMRNLYIP